MPFLKSKVKVLGFIVGREGVEADLEKIRAVSEFPTPANIKAVRSFVGLCSYYRRFIKGFAWLAAPLHALSKKDVPFTWGAEQGEAFSKLKDAMTTAPVLVHFDITKDAEIHPARIAGDGGRGSAVGRYGGRRGRVRSKTKAGSIHREHRSTKAKR